MYGVGVSKVMLCDDIRPRVSVLLFCILRKVLSVCMTVQGMCVSVLCFSLVIGITSRGCLMPVAYIVFLLLR